MRAEPWFFIELLFDTMLKHAFRYTTFHHSTFLYKTFRLDERQSIITIITVQEPYTYTMNSSSLNAQSGLHASEGWSSYHLLQVETTNLIPYVNRAPTTPRWIQNLTPTPTKRRSLGQSIPTSNQQQTVIRIPHFALIIFLSLTPFL